MLLCSALHLRGTGKLSCLLAPVQRNIVPIVNITLNRLNLPGGVGKGLEVAVEPTDTKYADS
jgi:hypothetical protein